MVGRFRLAWREYAHSVEHGRDGPSLVRRDRSAGFPVHPGPDRVQHEDTSFDDGRKLSPQGAAEAEIDARQQVRPDLSGYGRHLQGPPGGPFFFMTPLFLWPIFTASKRPISYIGADHHRDV